MNRFRVNSWVFVSYFLQKIVLSACFARAVLIFCLKSGTAIDCKIGNGELIQTGVTVKSRVEHFFTNLAYC